MNEFFEFVATLSTGLFAGAAVFISLVEHPARIECGTELAITEFGPSYHRASRMQAPLAIMGFASGVAASIEGSVLWLVGGVLIGAVIPLTLLVVSPTNKQLLDPSLDKGSLGAAGLLRDWGRLHALRRLLGVAAFATFLLLLASR